MNNLCPGNKLILTTHSPYIIGFLNIAIQGHGLTERARAAGKQDWEAQLAQIVPIKALVSGSEVAVYEMESPAGRIHRLPSPDKSRHARTLCLESAMTGRAFLAVRLQE